MNEKDRAAVPKVLQFDRGCRRSMPQSSDLTIGLELPMYPPLATKKGSQEKQRKMNKEKEGLGYQGDESECSGIAMGSETSFV